jgi:serine/threonine protein kinase
MPKYCCFCCPSADYSEKALTDICPKCKNPFGFPLTNYPRQIGAFEILAPIDRGFYSATYKAKSGKLGKIRVLKVSPKAVYKLHKKDFVAECTVHHELSGSAHIVDIEDYFDDSVAFPGIRSIDCHIAVLEYVDGPTLDEFLKRMRSEISTDTIAQIAIDLLRLWYDVRSKNMNHNDLHDRNIIIQSLGRDVHRANEFDGSIRAVAIDLGSAADHTKSDPLMARLGDQQWVVSHLLRLAEWLRPDPDKSTSLDFRVATAIEETAQILGSSTREQRLPSIEERIEFVQATIHQVYSPWKQPLSLNRYSDMYNALTLSPWYVPLLLVDPGDTWSSRIAGKGPQVITGMRGCGKTMILRSLEFHARATARRNEPEAQISRRLASDKYLGLFISCCRLLEDPSGRIKKAKAPYERLLLAYASELVSAIRHVHEIDEKSVNSRYPQEIAACIASLLSNVDAANILGDFDIDRLLRKVVTEVERGNPKHELSCNPVEAFNALAEVAQRCCKYWNNANVLFLLDDVTTRYIPPDLAQDLFSRLLFQSERCAFKLTTEPQMLDLGFQSPGKLERASAGRDYDLFDLGVEVYARTGGASGWKFVDDILAQRAQYYSSHPTSRPVALLGDESLTNIARRITNEPSTSARRKEVYHGISALAAVCVGDIGDIIRIYEKMLVKVQGTEEVPIRPSTQTKAYLDLCSERLFELNQRKPQIKEMVTQFAEASHQLLVESSKKRSSDQQRLRQYTKIYVRITTGDRAALFVRLKEMVDCGAFVFSGGAPRTKVRDGDPLHYFKLTFRRILGLSSYIPLAERDRFELSGDQLQEWLEFPERGKEILLRNLSKKDEAESETLAEDEDTDALSPNVVHEQAQSHTSSQLFIPLEKDILSRMLAGNANNLPQSPARVSAKRMTSRMLASHNIDTVVLGLGFEERAKASAELIFSTVDARNVVAVSYREKGHSSAILRLAKRHCDHVKLFDYGRVFTSQMKLGKGNVLVDVSGLAKPVIFQAVRNALRVNRRVFIAHTKADTYYPTEAAIDKVRKAQRASDMYALLSALNSIFTGEQGPYAFERLLISSSSGDLRRRVLFAFASAKHERLLSFLNGREYDSSEIIAPNAQNARAAVAKIAAEIAASKGDCARVSLIDSNNLQSTLEFLIDKYQLWYVDGGANVEVGLTGSKLQTVAASALSSVYKLSQVWYIRPAQFDTQKFTTGTGATSFYEVRLSEPETKTIYK